MVEAEIISWGVAITCYILMSYLAAKASKISFILGLLMPLILIADLFGIFRKEKWSVWYSGKR